MFLCNETCRGYICAYLYKGYYDYFFLGTIFSGGEYHRLHVQFRPPDDGPVRPETCRGKKIDIVRRQKSSVSSWK